MKKVLSTALLSLALVGTASADPVHIDWTGTGFGFDSTYSFDQLNVKYRSVTTILDVDKDGLTAGDTITTYGGTALIGSYPGYAGLAQLAIGENIVSGANPGATVLPGPIVVPTFPSDYSADGFASSGDWALTFALDNLVGVFDGEFFNYTSGLIHMQVWDTVNATFSNLFTMDLASGGYDAANSAFSGELLTAVGFDAFVEDVTGTTFGAYNADPANDTNVRFLVNQNTDNAVSGAALIAEVNANALVEDLGTQQLLTITGQHNGNIQFQVPEPTSLAILGLGLLGFAGVRRRNS